MANILSDLDKSSLPELTMLVDDSEITSAAQALRRATARSVASTHEPSSHAGDLHPDEHAYIDSMTAALQQIGTPGFLVDFMASTWSRVMLAEATRMTSTGRLEQITSIGVNLVMSTQPKTTSAQREALERIMPALIAGLEQGMRQIGVDEHQRRSFFGRLMPAQAEALRGGALTGMITTQDASSVSMALSRILNPNSYGVGTDRRAPAVHSS